MFGAAAAETVTPGVASSSAAAVDDTASRAVESRSTSVEGTGSRPCSRVEGTGSRPSSRVEGTGSRPSSRADTPLSASLSTRADTPLSADTAPDNYYGNLPAAEGRAAAAHSDADVESVTDGRVSAAV